MFVTTRYITNLLVSPLIILEDTLLVRRQLNPTCSNGETDFLDTIAREKFDAASLSQAMARAAIHFIPRSARERPRATGRIAVLCMHGRRRRDELRGRGGVNVMATRNGAAAHGTRIFSLVAGCRSDIAKR
jgi:hypothetical protein